VDAFFDKMLVNARILQCGMAFTLVVPGQDGSIRGPPAFSLIAG